MSNKFSYVYTTQEGIKKTVNANIAPTTLIKSFSQESNGFYTVTLDFYDANINLQKCIEIFPVVPNLPFIIALPPEIEKKSIVLYKKLKEEFVTDKKIPATDEAAFILYTTLILESKKSYVFKTKEGNRYFMCLEFVKTQEDADKMMNNLMYCYFTKEELKYLLTKALQQDKNISKFGKFIEPYLQNKKENTSIKVSPYNPDDSTIKMFGTFFNASETYVNKLPTASTPTASSTVPAAPPTTPTPTTTIIPATKKFTSTSDEEVTSTKNNNGKIVVVAIIILIICIGLYYYFSQNKKKSPEVK